MREPRDRHGRGMKRGGEIARQGKIVLREDVGELADIADDESGEGGGKAFGPSDRGLDGFGIGFRGFVR